MLRSGVVGPATFVGFKASTPQASTRKVLRRRFSVGWLRRGFTTARGPHEGGLGPSTAAVAPLLHGDLAPLVKGLAQNLANDQGRAMRVRAGARAASATQGGF